MAVATLGGAAVGMRHLNLGLALAQISALPSITVLVVMATAFAQALVLATRLWSVFPRARRPGWASVARAFGFGQFANSWLPGRAGDVLKVVAISDDHAKDQATVADATGVVLADKALDVVTLGGLVLVFAPALLVGLAAGALHAAWMAGAAVMLATAAGVAIRRWWPAGFQGLVRGMRATWNALRGLKAPRRLGVGLALGSGAWLFEAASFMLLSAPLGVHLSIAQAMITLLVLNLGIAVPVSVANVGAYEAATMVGLTSFGVAPQRALAIGAIHHIVQLVTVVLFALAFWLRDRVANVIARRRAARAAEVPAPDVPTLPAMPAVPLLPAAPREKTPARTKAARLALDRVGVGCDAAVGP